MVLRDVTERPEALATGLTKLVGTDPETIRSSVEALIDDVEHYRSIAKPAFPYGNGTAARQIVDILQRDAGL